MLKIAQGLRLTINNYKLIITAVKRIKYIKETTMNNKNIIPFKQTGTPNDLMTFNELTVKHGFKYAYLYKHSCITGEITVYPRGTLKLSEKEVLDFEQRKALAKYGLDKERKI